MDPAIAQLIMATEDIEEADMQVDEAMTHLVIVINESRTSPDKIKAARELCREARAKLRDALVLLTPLLPATEGGTDED